MFSDADGAKHALAVRAGGGSCGLEGWEVQDFEGPDQTAAGIWAVMPGPGQTPSIWLADGTQVAWPVSTGVWSPNPDLNQRQTVLGPYKDSNGNSKTETAGGLDTLGRAIVTQQNGTNQILYKVYDSSGVQRTYTLNFANVSLTTNFNLSGPYGPIQEVTGGARLSLSSLILPNGRSYTFQYEPSGYGGITRIDLPSGAYITYTWGTLYTTGVSAEERVHRYVTSRTVHVDGQSYTWNISRIQTSDIYPGEITTTVTDPLGNQSVYVSLQGSVTSAKVYQGSTSGTLLREFTIAYTAYGAPVGEGARVPSQIVTKLENGLQSKKEFEYEEVSYDWSNCIEGDAVSCWPEGGLIPSTPWVTTRGNVKEIREYDWGSGAPGPLVRRTTKEYLHANNSNYLSRNIVSNIIKETVFDGSNPSATDCLEAYGCKARTEFEYDSTAITATSGVPQHDYTNYGSTFIYRGNATKVKKWRNTDGALLTTSYIYDDLGNIRSITDTGSHTTTWDYNDNWSGTGCLPPSNSLAYVKQVTNHLGHRVLLSRYPCTGLVQSRKDENDILAARPGVTFTYDLFGRTVTKLETDGQGQTTFAYNDVPPVSVTTTSKITSALNLVSTAIQDGLGRVKQTQLTSDPEGATLADTTFDALGRKACETNPYRGTPPPNTSTCYEYDALGRATKVIPPDGTPTSNNVVTAYAGTTVTVTDQAGKVRKSETDGLGRLIRVWEPNSSGSLVNKTRYFYDTLDNLTCVLQLATDAEPSTCTSPSATWRPRTFTYNSLSQLLTAVNPESGTINYTYDSDGNVLTKVAPKPNQTGALTVTTTYAYDALHRLTQKSYNDGTTATVKYGYDAVALSGCATAPPSLTILNGKGRRTAMCEASGATSWSYDPEGATLTEKRTIQGSSAITKTISYTYNLDGSLATLVNPSGRTITYTPSAAGRTLSAVDTANSINYATGALYSPAGALRSLTNGASLVSTLYYNSRLQPCRISVKSSDIAPGHCAANKVGNVLDFQYEFASGTANNGNVVAITNNRDTNRSQNFTYDELNRVAYAWSSGNLWGNKFVYDIWANLNKKLACDAGSPCAGKPQGENLDQSAGTKNQFAGFCYDAAGNLNGQSLCPILTYVYDAENRLVTVAGVTYTYDGDGKRVKKSNGKLYWTGTGSDALAETDLAGVIQSEFTFFNGKRVARRDGSGNTVFYYFSGHLGSASVVTNATGTIVEESDYYPFGGERVITNSDPNQYKFTGKERDGESGLDYFIARHYSSNLGRFLQPDEFAGGPVDAFSSNDPLPDSPLPYADITNPQQLNKYAYTTNNPLRYVDPDGHDFGDFVDGVVNAVKSNITLGLGRQEAHNGDFAAGQVVGDAVSVLGGAVETAFGLGTTGTGVAACATGVGCAAGAPAVVAGAGIAAHGTTTATIGLVHLTEAASGNYDLNPQNAELTGQGKAPIGKDGHKVELHHQNQSPKGPVKEMTRTDHRGKGNYNKNHPFGNRRPSRINKAKAKTDREKYWKKQHDKEFEKKKKK